MALDINNYIGKTNYWSSIRDYVISAHNLETTSDNADQYALRHIKSLAKANLGDSYQNFDKFLRNYKNGNYHSFSRQTLYLLIFSLGIKDINEAQYFVRNIVHQNELSPRSLKEFIILCSIKLNQTYEQTLFHLSKYNERIAALKKAPEKIAYNKTYTIYDEVITEKINSVDDMYKYLDDTENIFQFALTRNTTYLMLFDEIGWDLWDSCEWKLFFNTWPDCAPKDYLSYTESQWRDFINEISQNGIPNNIMQKLVLYYFLEPETKANSSAFNKAIKARNEASERAKDQLSDEYSHNHKCRGCYKFALKDYYMQRFSLFETYVSDENTALTEDEINILAADDSYSTAFVTFDTYKKLYKRDLTKEIPSGLFLLSLVQKSFSDNEYEDEFSLLFNPDCDFIKQCNEYLQWGGFAALNRNNLFDRLFEDTYNEIYTENGNVNSLKLKPLFISRLRSYLKAIASKLLADKQNNKLTNNAAE